MKLRLYFLIPDTRHAQAVVNDLVTFGVNTSAMHVLAKPGIELNGLSVGSTRQDADADARLDTTLRDGNLVIFFVALLALVTLLYLQLEWYWLLLPASIMVITFAMGVVIISRVSDVHLAEINKAIHHGEILLMVDIPLWKVARIETMVRTYHPETTAAGVGWHFMHPACCSGPR